MVVLVGLVLKVHMESRVHVAHVVMVVQLSKRLVGPLSFTVEAFEQMVT